MPMQPLADVADALGQGFNAAGVRTLAHQNGLHIETVDGVEAVDLEAIRAILKIQAIQPRLDDLETRANGAVITVQPAANGWIVPALSIVVAALAAGGALWAANTASEQAAESTRALKATSGFAALEQFIGGLENTTGPENAKEVRELRLWLAKKMKDECVVSATMWTSFLEELCSGSKDSDPEFLKAECATLLPNEPDPNQAQSGTADNTEDCP